MPEMYDENNLSVSEDDAADYALDSLMVEEDVPQSLEVSEDDALEEDISVTDEDYDTVPGSNQKYEEFNAEDSDVEVKEKTWEEDKDPGKFLDWVKTKLTQIPRHSGSTIPGCERAISYLKDLDNQASKAMRSDFEGKIDEVELDKVRKSMRDMSDRLENHIQRLQKNASEQRVRFVTEGECEQCKSQAPVWYDAFSKKAVCINCESEEDVDGLQKTAGLPALKVFMTPWERAVVGIIINATVSGGKNIEDVYEKLKNKYDFTPREELAIQQLVADHGYPIYKDRGLLNEPDEVGSGNGVEWQTNYHA